MTWPYEHGVVTLGECAAQGQSQWVIFWILCCFVGHFNDQFLCSNNFSCLMLISISVRFQISFGMGALAVGQQGFFLS